MVTTTEGCTHLIYVTFNLFCHPCFSLRNLATYLLLLSHAVPSPMLLSPTISTTETFAALFALSLLSLLTHASNDPP